MYFRNLSRIFVKEEIFLLHRKVSKTQQHRLYQILKSPLKIFISHHDHQVRCETKILFSNY